MPLRASMLVLGTRGDALLWRGGCTRLGMDVVTPIREPRPSLSQLKKFFLATPDWMLFGGHFDARGLFNDREYEGLDDEGVVVDFGKDRVRVVSHRKRAT